MPKPILLNLQPEQLPALLAAMDIALNAASGYSVRTCLQRDVISQHWGEFNALHERIKRLEGQRELGMAHNGTGRKYIHVSIDETVYDRLYDYLLKCGGGRVRPGVLGHVVEKAVEQYLDCQNSLHEDLSVLET